MPGLSLASLLLVALPITNGTPDAAHPAVVAIVDEGGTMVCTGTLIGLRTVLTAAHCVVNGPSRSRVVFGSSVAGGDFVDVSDARVHPDFDPATLANDVAMLTIRTATTAAPLPLDARALDASFVGQTFLVVGFGVTAPGAADDGVKRAGMAQVTAVDPTEIRSVGAPSQPCDLDSGGPALFDDGGTTVVTGVVSRGDATCSMFAIHARVDVVVASFIQPYRDETAPGTAHTGDPCLHDTHCAEGACLPAADDADLWFCSQPCDDGACPDLLACVDAVCRYPLPSPGAPGWPCDDAADCADAICHEGSCTRTCLGGGEECPAGFVCEGVGGLDYYCLRAPSSGCCQVTPGGPAGRSALPLGSLALLAITALALVAARRSGRSGSPRGSRRRTMPAPRSGSAK